MLTIGLTSSIASGKSFVTKEFKKLGAKVIDADKIVHKLYKKNKSLSKKIFKKFGKKILTKKGINFKLLSETVFHDFKKLRELERIIHPLVLKEIKSQLKKFQTKQVKIVLIDVPLLIEAGWENYFDFIVVVKSTKTKQLKQLMKRNHMSRKEALIRINSQLPISVKLKFADYIIDNSKTISYTKKQIKHIYNHMRIFT